MTSAVERRGAGIALVAASAVAYSTAGFFTRLIPLDVWTILFWRGLFAGAFVALVAVVQAGRRTPATLRGIGWPGLVATLCSGVATILFINAFRQTSVADVVIIFATAPFVTAGLGRLVFGTRESRTTLAASAVALAGVVVMVGGAANHGRLLGDVLAFGMTVLMSVYMLIIRHYQDTPMLPASSLSAFLCAALAWPVAMPLAPDSGQMLNLALFGVTQFGLGLLLLTLGTRLVSATESALINTLEVPLAAFWVWLAFAEMPPRSTIVGGAIVITAVIGNIVAGETGASPPRTQTAAASSSR